MTERRRSAQLVILSGAVLGRSEGSRIRLVLMRESKYWWSSRSFTAREYTLRSGWHGGRAI